MNRLQSKLAVIMGGTGGGRSLSERGACVAFAGRDQKNADQAKDLLGRDDAGGRTDVSKLGELDALNTIRTSK
jgi:NAD(P)-dependent dehydrogenase (short-subunit alcohol dehydrogenase family)